MAAPALARAPGLPDEAQQPGPPLAPRLVASGVAVLLHGGLAGLLLFAPAAPPSPSMPEVPPILAVLAEPVTEESPARVPAAQAAAAPDSAAAPIEEAPPDPPPPEAPPPERAPAEPAPATSEPAPAEAPSPEPPLPEPVPDSPQPEPLPEPPPPAPQPPPEPRPAPRPRPVARPVQPRHSAVASPVTDAAPVAAPAPAARPAGPPPSYLQALAAALERRKRYPEAARARRATGIALLRFTVTRDGRVARWRIERSTGDADLDRAVEDMISRAILPAMPADMPGDSLEVAVPVRFQIR